MMFVIYIKNKFFLYQYNIFLHYIQSKEIVNFQLNYLILHIGSVASLERGSCVQKYDRKSDTDIQH
ncbi:hypothetical protein GLOIN_2v1543842, partial [Rhizophagus irregularis DAOM 181602=DAOM 197198]